MFTYHFVEIVEGKVVRIVNNLNAVYPNSRFNGRVRMLTAHQYEILSEFKFKIDEVPMEKIDDEVQLAMIMINIGNPLTVS